MLSTIIFARIVGALTDLQSPNRVQHSAIGFSCKNRMSRNEKGFAIFAETWAET